MAMWPFRRKSRRKRGRANTTDEEEPRGLGADSALPPRSQTEPDAAIIAIAPAIQRQASKKQRAESNKLQRKPRAFSFSPDRHDSVRLGRKMSTRARRGPDTNFQTRHEADSGIGAGNDDLLWRVPTLHNKRDGDHLPRKKSSKKRRKDDHEREAEIKAMSSFVPVRPATEEWMAGRPMKKETKTVKAGLGSSLKGSEWDRMNRSSDVSLPHPESIHSALTSDSDFISYKVSALEALAPRPTLRYSTNSRSGACARDATGLFRRPSQQRTKLSAPIPEATLRAHKRIDDIADDLSASDLRELMERDQRRQARKRKLEQERLEKRMARRAEKQKAVEAESLRQGRQSPPNLERGVLGREDVGLGIGPASAVVTSSRIRDSDDLTKQRVEFGENDDTEAIQDDVRLHPLAAFHRIDSIPAQPPKAPPKSKEPTGPVLASPEPKDSLHRNLSRSKSPQNSEVPTVPVERPRQGSEGSSFKGPFSWASFFKWGNKNKRHSGGPSSFSNTSRDSMQTTPAPATPIRFMPRRLSSGVPKRTMSRFREDLPELPISPPASRLQSPEAEAIHPVIETSPAAEESSAHPALQPRQDTPVSEQRSVEGMRQTPSTFSRPDEPGVSPEPQSMSLASIDSEASWFSGKLSKKRKSSGILEHAPSLQFRRHTPESDNDRIPEHESIHEEIFFTDDDYLSRLAPSHGNRSGENRKSTGDPTAGEGRPSSDWGDEPHWGSVKGQQPTVVHSHTMGRIQSREGVLKSYSEEGEATLGTMEPAGNTSSSADEEESLRRATSLSLEKGHARRISVGSARLRSTCSSVEAKRASTSAAAEAPR